MSHKTVNLDDINWDNTSWKDLRDASIQERFTKKNVGLKIEPKSENQKTYIDLINQHVLVIATGSPGSGKSFIPIGIALQMLKEKSIQKFIVTRPMVECGRKLGAMPGDLSEKYGVYMRPVFDNMLKFISNEELTQYLKNGEIEFIPLELMRGSTLDNSFVLLDEAQNVEKTQMLMFLTRIGENSKVVVCGDLEQQDNILNFKDYQDKYEGLSYALRNLIEDSKNIGKIAFTDDDIIRSKIVKLILSQWKEGA